jgi:hypothetical protein
LLSGQQVIDLCRRHNLACVITQCRYGVPGDQQIVLALRISRRGVAALAVRSMHRRVAASYLKNVDERLRIASIGCAVCVAASPWVWLALFLYGHV